MEASKAPPLTLSGKSAGREPMLQAHIIRSNTFQWALAVAGVFAVFVIALFGFIYWQTDQYLIARSDRMIATQLNVIAGLPNERRLDWINEHLEQDSRGAHYRADFPDVRDLARSRYTCVTWRDGRFEVATRAVEFTRVRPGESLLKEVAAA